MQRPRDNAVRAVLAGALLVTQGCTTPSKSGTGEGPMAHEERIVDPAIKEILPNHPGMTTSGTTPAMRAELSARNANGSTRGTLADALFDFDRASLRVDAFPVLEANAHRLKEDGAKQVLLEGRGDEVGTVAYNIVLGDRRAKSVKSYLQQLGISAEFKTTSYGKDRPLCIQHSPECWQKNRSVHFVVGE